MEAFQYPTRLGRCLWQRLFFRAGCGGRYAVVKVRSVRSSWPRRTRPGTWAWSHLLPDLATAVVVLPTNC